MFKRMSLKVKLIALFLMIGLIPAVAISFLSYRSTAEQLKKDAFNQLDMFAALSREQLEESMDGKEGAVEVMALTRNVYQSMNVLKDVGWDTTDPRWLERVEMLEEFAPTMVQKFNCDFFFVTSPAGEIVFSTYEEMVGDDLSVRNYIQEALAGNIAWSEIFYSDVVYDNIQTVSAPVRSNCDTGEIIGTVTLALDQVLIAEAVHEGIKELGHTADSYLIDAEGLLLTSTMSGEYAEEAVLKQRIDSPAVAALSSPIKSGNYGFYEHEEYKNYLGKDVLGALNVAKIGDDPMGFVVEIEAAEVLAEVAAMRNYMFSIAAFCTLLIAGLAYYIAQTVIRPVQKVSDLTLKLAEGDFTTEAEVASEDEIGQMALNINNTVQALRTTLQHVQAAADNVSHASDEISVGNQDLSQRTEEQASSLEEIASTIEEIASSLEASSAHSMEADNLSNRTLESVQRGENVVGEMQGAMSEITQGNQEIAEIIAKVNDIAFQTNLLALNAAVEAARAGEQGRGFAVVAAEVRNLAGHSAESAKEIEKLIKDSIVRVDKGNSLMDETEKVLQEIIENTQKTSDVVGEIASSLKEQSSAAGDIRSAVEELNQVTQQNASLVEEIASSSENMNSEAVELADQVSFFKLSSNDRVDGNGVLATRPRPEKNGKKKAKKAVSAREAGAVAALEEPEYEFDEDDFEEF